MIHMNWLRSLGAGFLIVLGAVSLGCYPETSPQTSGSAPQPSQARPERDQQPPERPLVEVTARAAETVTRIVKEQGIEGSWYFRVEASWPKGICSPQHRLDIETSPSESDSTFESAGIKVVVLKRQVEMFRGARVDYGEKDGKQGFLVDNPNFEGDLLKKWGPVVAADPLSAAK